MGFVAKCTIIFQVDTLGDVFLSENTSVTQVMKHIDVHHHFICEYVEDGTVKLLYVRSEEILADSFTNNLSGRPSESLTSRYVHCW